MKTSSMNFPTDSHSPCSFKSRPIFPKHLFPTSNDTSSSCYCYEESAYDTSSYEASFSSNSRNFEMPCAKSCNFPNLNPGVKYSNVPTAIKENSNQEANRRNTLKLKNANPEPSTKFVTSSSSNSIVVPGTLKRNLGDEVKVQKSVVNVKKNANVMKTPVIRTVSFMKVEKGKIVGRRNFNCFREDDLSLPKNINKFLQNMENDDDVETDDETLEYYIDKVRRQLEEAVEEEKMRKIEKKMKEEEEKENLIRMKKAQNTVIFSNHILDCPQKIENAKIIRSKTLKVVSNK